MIEAINRWLNQHSCHHVFQTCRRYVKPEISQDYAIICWKCGKVQSVHFVLDIGTWTDDPFDIDRADNGIIEQRKDEKTP